MIPEGPTGASEGLQRVSANGAEVIAQYQTTRVRHMWSSYKRIFQLTADDVLTLEPSSLSVTNRFEYSGISKIFPDKKSDDQFYFDYETKNFIFKTLCRSQLLTQLYECMHRKLPTQLKSFGPYNAKRLRKGGTKVDCKIAVTAYGLVECDGMGKVLQEYKYVNCSRCGVDIKSSAFFIEISGRTKIFLVDQCSNLYSNCKDQILSLALRKKSEVQFVDLILTEEVAHRVSANNTAHATVSMFDVSKLTRRSVRPVSRQMHITEELIVEKDSSGFQTISNQRIDNIYAIVRSWASHREFTIEYSNGMSRTYSCAVRDTLLATLLDICHAVGNTKVIITGEISDNLRLLPRDVNEEYHSSIKDSIFGASSIESWLLSRLILACKPVSSDTKIVESACRDFNANVPCPGIAPGTEIHLVRNALTGVLTNLHREVVAALADERTDNSRLIITLLQTLYRIIPCVHGYKCFLEVKEIDTRLLLLQLMKLDRDFVNYWTLEVLSVLCRCPLAPRRQQEEFVNKHTLLTDRMLKCLIDLMSNRLDGDGDGADEAATTSVSVDASSSTSQRPVGVSAESSAAEERKSHEVSDQRASKEGASSGGTAIASNPLPTAHLGIGEPSFSSTQKVSSTTYPGRVDTGPIRLQPFSSTSAPSQQLHGGAIAPSSRTSLNREKDRDSTESAFFPNSLVIVSAATLLESIVFSRRDTSSPELLNSFLDLLSERSEVLIHMLRSNSFLILENAAILMFILLKNRGSSAKMLKELALSEALTLKHFYNAVFSPSVNQRYISRFLVNTWVSGSEKKNPGKALLCRMIPTGLVEYLRHAPISEEHKAALDDIEDEFYANSVGGNGGGRAKTGRNGTNITDVQARMRRRISQVLGEKPFAPQICAAHARSGITHDQQLQLQQQQQPRGVVTPVKPDDTTDDQQYSPSQTALMASTTHVLTPPREVGEGAVFFAENYRVMFHMMTQNHQLPDLIWNERTRLELRSAIDNEIKSFDREQRLRGSKKVAWNFQQFGVTYESLRGEMQVGSIYIRHFLEAGDSFFRSLENPSPVVLFEKLFRRVLVNVNRNAQLSIVCCRSLSRLYSVCWDSIGAFDDMLLIVKMLDEATNIELQHCLLDLIELLSAEESNLHQLLDKTFVASIIKYASLAHLNPDQIGNVLARLTSNVLTIKCGEVSGPPSSQGTSPKQSNVQGQGEGSQKDPAQRPRSLWIPDDFACPRVWFVAPSMPSSLGALPPVQSRRGPFRVSEIMEMLDRKDIGEDSLVAPFMGDDGGDEERFDSVVDTGRWRPLKSYDQLRMQLLSPGIALYSPAEIATKALGMLSRLAAVHRSANFRGVAFFPIPTSKRLMSDPEHLSLFSQLLLSNNSMVVETAAVLIKSLVEFNSQSNNKLYLTGAFYFACRYSGNNFFPLARLFDVSHVQQSFFDSAATLAQNLPLASRSFLANLLPAAVVNILINYGPDRFASVFTGDFDTPEVIWNAVLRQHLVEMIEQHIGDFPARLRQFSLASYDFCPIPRIHYVGLNKEIYVHEYYLRNFCDEVKFPNWPVGEPLVFLRESLQRWRTEMAKGVEDSAVEDAKNVLGFEGKQVTYADLRRSYKNLARKFHPDKNPNGRQMFEKIRIAYELLSSVDMEVTETDLDNVVLLIKAQNIIYRRFPDAVSDQKYPAFQHLLDVLTVPLYPAEVIVASEHEDEDEEARVRAAAEPSPLDSTHADLLLAGTTLVYNTCSVSPLNVKEFVKVGGTRKLFDIVLLATRTLTAAPPSTSSPGMTNAASKVAHELLLYALKAFTSIAAFDVGRSCILALCPLFAETMCTLLLYDKVIPLAVESCIETISRCCEMAELQKVFECAGLVWRLVPMLLAYDGTLQEDYADESLRFVHCQNSSNMHAVLAAKALGRLAGVMFLDLASPPNPPLVETLNLLLTQPIAKLLRNRRPWDLLSALNQNVERTTMIWNLSMRKQLLEFVLRVDRDRAPGSHEGDLLPAETFNFSALDGELCVCGVYLRIFNRTAVTVDIDDPSLFAKDLLDCIRALLLTPHTHNENSCRTGNGSGIATDSTESEGRGSQSIFGSDEESCFRECTTGVEEWGLDPSESEHYRLQLTVDALRTLTDVHSYIAFDIATHVDGPDTVFLLLDLPSTCPAFLAATQLLTTLGRSADFVSLAMKKRAGQPSCLWRLLRAACTTIGPGSSFLWSAAEGYSSHVEGLRCLLDSGGVAHMLGVLASASGYTNNYQNRLNAMSLMSKFLSSPVMGDEASTSLRRFLPEPLVVLMRSKESSASLVSLDEVCETPELIWTAEMQMELRTAVATLLGGQRTVRSSPLERARGLEGSGFFTVPCMAQDFKVTYRQLDEEIYVGNVYIRLFMKQPTFRLSNPIFFLERLVELWEHSFNKQVPLANSSTAPEPSGSGTGAGSDPSIEILPPSQALILGKEDFLSVLTSCIVCVVKSDIYLTTHLLSWGFLESICLNLKRALDFERRGEPITCVVRLLYQLADNPEAVERLAAVHVDAIAQITRVIRLPTLCLPQESAFIVEMVKKIYAWGADVRTMDHLVSMALGASLPQFLLDGVINASPKQLSGVRSPSALRVHAVDALKAMLAASSGTSTHSVLSNLLNQHPAWADFRHQSHDLFLTDLEKTDHFLIQDSTETRFAGLLTNGSNASAASQSADASPLSPAVAARPNERGSILRPGGFADGNTHRGSDGPGTSIPPTGRSYGFAPQPAQVDTMPYLPTQPILRLSPSRGPSMSNDSTSGNRSSITSSSSGRISNVSSGDKAGLTPERVSSPSDVSPRGTPLPLKTDGPGPGSGPRRVTYHTSVAKGDHGIGLDLGKTADGRVVIQRFKELPVGVPNPAANAIPKIKPGDFIIGINGVRRNTFADCVLAIRSSTGAVEIELERVV